MIFRMSQSIYRGGTLTFSLLSANPQQRPNKSNAKVKKQDPAEEYDLLDRVLCYVSWASDNLHPLSSLPACRGQFLPSNKHLSALSLGPGSRRPPPRRHKHDTCGQATFILAPKSKT